jgi:hypothetical protein
MICNVEMRERKLSRYAPANRGKEDRPEALRFVAHLLGIFIVAHRDALRMIKFGYLMGFRNPRELKGRTRGCTGAVGYATTHPALIWVAVGMLIGWLATRVVSWMLLRHRGDSIDDWYAFSFLLLHLGRKSHARGCGL